MDGIAITASLWRRMLQTYMVHCDARGEEVPPWLFATYYILPTVALIGVDQGMTEAQVREILRVANQVLEQNG